MSWAKGNRVSVPTVSREGEVCGCEGGNQMVLRRAYGTLSGVCALGVQGDVLEGNEVQHEEGGELGGGFVVKFEVSDRKAKRVKERQYNFEGGDICRRRARLHGVIVDKATVESDEDILVTKIRRDRKTTSEIGGGPFRVMGGVGVALIRGGGRSKAGRATQRG
jgi:hypothetical protein